ncbi:unnamed protein product [Diabrotica balteata]|uniref:Uncharacterized protein n=1 Tax=Diabrotica balteata TaxID=107213 RepID=A0A9N9TFS8_DIABA|nr:unnamed protein product [Diabrotica balteata]
MLISPKKTKCMVTTANLLRCKLKLEGQIIEQVIELKYLGITLSSYEKLETEDEDQVNRANRAAGCVNETIWRNKNIGKETNGKIHKTVIRPIMIYAAETRTRTERQKRILEIAEIKIDVENIKNWVRNKGVEWNDHISRITTNRYDQ